MWPNRSRSVRSASATASSRRSTFRPRPAAGCSAEDQTRTAAAAPERLQGVHQVMLSYGYWQRRFGGDPSVVGRTIIVDSRPKEIVGVMPRGIQDRQRRSGADLSDRVRSGANHADRRRHRRRFQVSGRRPAPAGHHDRAGQRRRRTHGPDLDELLAGGRAPVREPTRRGESHPPCVLSKRRWSAA